MDLGVTWSSRRHPCPWGNIIFMVPSNQNYSMILSNYDLPPDAVVLHIHLQEKPLFSSQKRNFSFHLLHTHTEQNSLTSHSIPTLDTQPWRASRLQRQHNPALVWQRAGSSSSPQDRLPLLLSAVTQDVFALKSKKRLEMRSELNTLKYYSFGRNPSNSHLQTRLVGSE